MPHVVIYGIYTCCCDRREYIAESGVYILCEHCFVVVLFFSYIRTCTYTTFEYPVHIFFHVEEQRKLTLQFYGNIAELAVHAQAVDTRLFSSSQAAWVRG